MTAPPAPPDPPRLVPPMPIPAAPSSCPPDPGAPDDPAAPPAPPAPPEEFSLGASTVAAASGGGSGIATSSELPASALTDPVKNPSKSSPPQAAQKRAPPKDRHDNTLFIDRLYARRARS